MLLWSSSVWFLPKFEELEPELVVWFLKIRNRNRIQLFQFQAVWFRLELGSNRNHIHFYKPFSYLVKYQLACQCNIILHQLLFLQPTYNNFGVTKYSTGACLIVSLNLTALRDPISLYVQGFILGSNIRSCGG